MLKPLISPMSSDLAKPIFNTYVLKLIALLIMQTHTTEERVDPVKNRKTLACFLPYVICSKQISSFRSTCHELCNMLHQICYQTPSTEVKSLTNVVKTTTYQYRNQFCLGEKLKKTSF